MLLYITVAAATILIAALIKPQESPLQIKGSNQITRQQMLNIAALLFIFMIFFVVSAIRFEVGHDYNRHVWFMHLIYHNAYVPTEIGFNNLVSIVYAIFGYGNYLIVFALIAFITISLFLWSLYRDSENFWFSFILFTAFGYYFQSFNTVRYYLAVAIALFAIPYVLKKKWLQFILLILLGATFHKSVLVVLPIYFLASLNWKKWMVLAAGLFCTTFLFLQDFYLDLLVLVYPTYRDTEFLEAGTSIVNIIRCSGILVFSLIYYRQAIKDNEQNRFYFYLNIGALILYTLCSFIPVISRIGYYLTITHIFFIPAIINRIDNKKQKMFFTIVTLLAAGLYFVMFLIKASDVGVRLLPYQTALFNEMNPIWLE